MKNFIPILIKKSVSSLWGQLKHTAFLEFPVLETILSEVFHFFDGNNPNRAIYNAVHIDRAGTEEAVSLTFQ